MYIMPRTNVEEITRILQFGEITLDNVWAVLEVQPNASVQEINDAYKHMAVKVHPDKNPSALLEAADAFSKLSSAKELATSGHKTTGSQTHFDVSEMFHPESGYMKGPLVREMRDIMMSFAGFFNRIVNIKDDEPRKIRHYFQHLELTNSKDSELLIKYSELLFPDSYKSSEDISENFRSQGLTDSIDILKMLSRRYPQLTEATNRCIENELDVKLREFATAFESYPIHRCDLHFSSFYQFSQVFLGAAPDAATPLSVEEGKISVTDTDAAAGWSILDAYSKSHAELLQRLVAIADGLRSLPNLDEPFIYSDSALEASPDRARMIDALCVASDGSTVTRKAILHAQLERFIYSILGVQGLLTPLSSVSFPKESMEIVCDQHVEDDRLVTTYKNVLTKEVFTDYNALREKYPWYRRSRDNSENREITAILPYPQAQNSSFLGAVTVSKGNPMVFLDNYYGTEYVDFLGSSRLGRPTTIVPKISALMNASHAAHEDRRDVREAPQSSIDEQVQQCRQTFKRLLNALHIKTKELIDKGTPSHRFYNTNYVNAKATAEALNTALSNAERAFFDNPITEHTFSKFKTDCMTAIDKSKQVLKAHRDTWHQLHPLIKGIIGVLATLLIIPALYVGLYTKDGYVQTFFHTPKTDSEAKLDLFEKGLQALPSCHL